MNNKMERGQSLIELAISLVVLLYLLSGIVEFGLAFFQFVQLRDAAQEGALYGSADPSDLAAIETRARESSNTPIDLDPAGSVKVMIFVDTEKVREDGTNQGKGTDSTWLGKNACEAHALKVRTEFDHKIFMPFVPTLIGQSTIRLNAEVTDTILRPVCAP